jgi:anti-sigma B factor antagonist
VEIDVRSRAGVNLIRLRGDLKMGQPVDSLRQAIDETTDGGGYQLVLNLTDVPMVDSSGIGVLVRTLTSVKQRGGSLKLVNPSKFTTQTLKLVGVLNLFEVFSEEEQALNSFAS